MENLNNYIFFRYKPITKSYLSVLPVGSSLPKNAEIIDVLPVWEDLKTGSLPMREIAKKHNVTYPFLCKVWIIALEKSQNN